MPCQFTAAHNSRQVAQISTSINFLMAQMAIAKRTRAIESQFDTMFLTAALDPNFEFKEAESTYHAYFLIKGGEINGNDWGVPEQSIPRNIKTFEGRPFLVTADDFIKNSPYKWRWMHPKIDHFQKYLPDYVKGLNPENLQDVLRFQDRWKVGDISRVLYDSSDDYWKAIIKPLPAFEHKDFPPFCSPGIKKAYVFENNQKIMNWQGIHLAGLMERPAYGSQAIYEGSFSGTLGYCMTQLSDTQSLFETSYKFTKERIAAVMSGDNAATNKVPMLGDCSDGGFAHYSKPCMEKRKK